MSRRLIVGLTLLALLALALIALAAESDPVAPDKAGRAGQEGADAPRQATRGVPGLDVNQAEIEALREGREDGEAQAEDSLELPSDKPGPHPEVNPLMVEIRSLLQEERAEVVTLAERFTAASDEQTALAIQQEIQEVKVRTELQILRLQADHARRGGREEVAQQIDAAITAMTTPRPVKEPVDRPAPESPLR